MLSRRSLLAFSLMEAVLSTFLLLTAVLLGAYVFHNSLRAEASNEKRVTATLAAENTLAEIQDFAGENFLGLVDHYDGTHWVSAQDPSMTISVKARMSQLAMACLELESQYPASNQFPAPEPRFLSHSTADVEIKVEWTEPSNQAITVVGRVADLHTASNFTVELLDQEGALAPESIALAKDGELKFRAQAKANGQLVKDIQFTWFVQPVIGFGSLSAVSRDGLFCVYLNAYRNYNDAPRYAPGACYLTLKATYQGRESTDRIRIDNE